MDVPISLGSDQAPGSCTLATFYVLDVPSYHWLLGLTFLEPIQGEVLCAPRVLRYKLGCAGDHSQVALALHPRSSVAHQPVMRLF